MSPVVGCPGPGGFLSGGAFVQGLFPGGTFSPGVFCPGTLSVTVGQLVYLMFVFHE